MKVNIDLENLENTVQTALSENINTIISEQIKAAANNYINKNVKDTIEEITSQAMTSYVNNYIKSATITVGGGFYSSDPAETYTVEEYVKKELGEAISKKTLKKKVTERYGSDRYEYVSFEDFIKDTLNVEELIKKQLASFVNDVRKQINDKVSELFETGTKNMLSDTVFNVLMQSDTYMNLSDSIKRIADRSES